MAPLVEGVVAHAPNDCYRVRYPLLSGGDAEVSGSHNGTYGPNIWHDGGIVVRTPW